MTPQRLPMPDWFIPVGHGEVAAHLGLSRRSTMSEVFLFYLLIRFIAATIGHREHS